MRELEADLGIPKTTVSKILTQDLGMKSVVAKFVLQLLLPEQKERRAIVADDVIQTATNEPDFLQVITGAESWVYGYDPEMKAHLSHWKSPQSPCPKKVRQSRSKIKTTLTVFFDWAGVVHQEYTPPGQTLKKRVLPHVLCRLRDAIGGKQLQL